VVLFVSFQTLFICLQVFQIPARLSVAGTVEYLAQLHGSHVSSSGVGLRVGNDYQFDDGFSRSEMFPFLDPSKPLQWYEEVVATTPLYWEHVATAQPDASSKDGFVARVVFPSKLGLAPAMVQLVWTMSITDAELAVEKASGNKVGEMSEKERDVFFLTLIKGVAATGGAARTAASARG
jgi:hypothetical protein